MKKLLILLFLGCFISLSFSATSATVTKIDTQKKTDFVLKQGQNSIKIKVEDSKSIDNAVQKINEQVSAQTSSFQICFVYVVDMFYQEAVDGTVYVVLQIEVHCYGDPNSGTIIIQG